MFFQKIRRTAKKFDFNTQEIRADLILDLKVLAEMAHEEATKIKERGRPTKEQQKWAQLRLTSVEASSTTQPNKREEETSKRRKIGLTINEKPRKKAEDSSRLYFPDRNTPVNQKKQQKNTKRWQPQDLQINF